MERKSSDNILAFLAIHEHASIWFLAHVINRTEEDTHRLLLELEKEGKVVQDKDGWKLN